MNSNNLVLSIFPGIGLLDRGFETCDFCIVRGPDILWGGDIKTFFPPIALFDGVIGGPPCQAFSALRHVNGNRNQTNLIPEFERVVWEAFPRWFLMENVMAAPEPKVPGFEIQKLLLIDGELGGNSWRKRKFIYGYRYGTELQIKPIAPPKPKEDLVCPAMASGYVRPGMDKHRSYRLKYMGWKSALALKHQCYAQGLPDDYCNDMPFTLHGKHRVIGNGVPFAMALSLARAIREANKI